MAKCHCIFFYFNFSQILLAYYMDFSISPALDILVLKLNNLL